MNKKKPDEVRLLIRGFGSLGGEKRAEEFFQMLHELGDKYIPTKLGVGEPLKTLYSIENAKKIWLESEKELRNGGGILFKGSSMNGEVEWNSDNSNSISLWIATKFVTANNGVNRFVKFLKKLFLWSNGVYGYACHISNLISTPGLNYTVCLGGITWLSLFGKPYVEMFGKEVLQSAPCKVEEFAENRFILLTSEEPIEESPELLILQEKVKKHLGEDAFYRNEPRKVALTMEDLIAGKNRPSTEGYRSPNLSAYIKESVTKKDEGLVAKVNDEGTIATYEIKSEKN